MAFHSFDSARSAPFDQGRLMSDINVTPLVDVMLVLLVIFIITAPLLTSAIRLDLPQTPAAQPSQAEYKVELVVDAEGAVYIDDQPQTTEALLRRLQQLAKAHPDTEVQLRADAAVPYGRMVEIIGTAQQAGLNRVGFVADGLAGGPAPGRKP